MKLQPGLLYTSGLLVGLAVFLALSTGYAAALEIVSVEQQRVEYEGRNVTLECTVLGKGFNFFFNQVIWYKSVVNGRDVQINTGAIINEPFNVTQRYSIDPDIITESELIVLPLTIADIRLDDNGTYRCCLFQKQNVLSSIVHTLIIPVAVYNLTLVIGQSDPNATLHEQQQHGQANATSSHSAIAATAAGSYEFEERKTTSVRCLSQGGNPTPVLRVFRGDDDITDEFTVKVSDQRTTETAVAKVLDVVVKDIEIFNDEFQADVEHHKKQLKCVALIPGHSKLTRVVTGRINVRYAPKFVCRESRSAYVDTHNYKIDCIIRANPVVKFDDISWEMADLNATSLTTGETENGFSAAATEDVNGGETVVKATLTIETIDWTKFGLYILSATNDAGQGYFYIQLQAAIVEEPIRPSFVNVTMLVKTNGRSRLNHMPPRNNGIRLLSVHPCRLLVTPAMACILITICF